MAGIGGYPYADGASGEVPYENVVYLCKVLGIEHGVDFNKVIEVVDFISKFLKR